MPGFHLAKVTLHRPYYLQLVVPTAHYCTHLAMLSEININFTTGLPDPTEIVTLFSHI